MVVAFALFILLSLISVFAISLSKQDLMAYKSKDKNKELLKELLEGFDLEIPAELEGTVIQSIKSF